MKVVFPSVGSLVLLKQDLETLKAFYKTSIMTSKLSEVYRTSTSMIQIGNFNYLPTTNSILLYNANVLTIEDMRKILGIFKEEQKTDSEKTETQNSSSDFVDGNHLPISDDDLLSNSFFRTLKPLN